MGSTITCGKAAAAFRHADGTVYYQLFERIYSSNVYPKTPKWEAHYFGPIAGAINTIFTCASDCEGGMLRGPSRSIKPESYIKAWLRELDEPRLLPDTTLRLAVGTTGLYDAFKQDRLPEVLAMLRQHGRDAEAATLESTRAAQFSLHTDAPLLCCLIDAELLSRFRLNTRYEPPAETSLDLGYALPPAPAPAVPAYLRLDGNYRLRQTPDGTWEVANWAYSIISDHIRAIGTLERGGCYRQSIPQLRQAVENAPEIPPGTQAVIDPRKIEDRESSTIAGLSEIAVSRHDDGRITVPVPYDPKSRLAWDIAHLPATAVTWIIPGLTPSAAQTPAAAAPAPAIAPSLFDLFQIPDANPA